MIKLIDVSDWFPQVLYFNPDYIVGVFQAADNKRTFCVATLADSVSNAWRSKVYADDKICELGMSEFCKKIQGDI